VAHPRPPHRTPGRGIKIVLQLMQLVCSDLGLASRHKRGLEVRARFLLC
jgi:hypothetical protein